MWMEVFIVAKKERTTDLRNTFKYKLKIDLIRNWTLWVMFLPVVVYYAIFNYAPMYGLAIAFKDYKVRKGILGSPSVGFKHFQRFFSSFNFWDLIGNTLGISVYSLVVGFPLAIILQCCCII